MTFVVELAFDERPERLAARPAHRQRLAELHDSGPLLMAGPFGDDTGALLVFEVADAQELARILDADPYYRTPGVRVVAQRSWKPVVG